MIYPCWILVLVAGNLVVSAGAALELVLTQTSWWATKMEKGQRLKISESTSNSFNLPRKTYQVIQSEICIPNRWRSPITFEGGHINSLTHHPKKVTSTRRIARNRLSRLNTPKARKPGRHSYMAKGLQNHERTILYLDARDMQTNFHDN